MSDLELLKLLLQEEKYPYFTDEQLTSLLLKNNNNVYLTASDLCLIKADGDTKVTVGPITIESAGAEYWITLHERYSALAISNNEGASSGRKPYITSLNRSDERYGFK